MQSASRRPVQTGRSRGSGLVALDKYSIIPTVACLYALIVYPMILSVCDMRDLECLSDTPPISRVFWPILFMATLILVVPNRARLRLPTHFACLLAYLAFAGLSVTWAFRPELSFIRYAQQIMIVASIVLPVLVADRRVDMMRVLFACFAVAVIINCFYVMGPPQTFDKNATPGHTGYFLGKNYLGLFAAVALLLSVHEVLYRGRRRVLGVIVGALAMALLFASNSKTAFGFALVAPVLATVAVVARKKMRLSPAMMSLGIVLGYLAIATLLGITVYRISYMVYGDSSFTGRRIIWEFAQYEIGRRPWWGWGYQSFWLVGPDAPSVLDAPGWVKFMPNAHSGYLDTILETGYAGFVLLLAFLFATLHAAGRLVDRDARQGWLVLSLAFFILFSNGLESQWMRAFEFLWVVFLFLVAELAGARQPLPAGGAMQHRSMRSAGVEEETASRGVGGVARSTGAYLPLPGR